MNPRNALVMRREALLARCAQLRAEQLVYWSQLDESANKLDQHLAHAARLLTNPLVVGAAAGTLLFLGPRQVFAWIRRGIAVWHFSRRALQWLAGIANPGNEKPGLARSE